MSWAARGRAGKDKKTIRKKPQILRIHDNYTVFNGAEAAMCKGPAVTSTPITADLPAASVPAGLAGCGVSHKAAPSWADLRNLLTSIPL
ncbi:MAG: hypothetical protein LBH43_05915 [Treponema sp.]|nr:hypothetical protein [Treponema sp.]